MWTRKCKLKASVLLMNYSQYAGQRTDDKVAVNPNNISKLSPLLALRATIAALKGLQVPFGQPRAQRAKAPEKRGDLPNCV